MKNIAQYIEHTALKPDTSLAGIIRTCEEANQHGFLGVCVPPYHVANARKAADEKIKIVTVVGFPFGYAVANAKKAEVLQALGDGADEIDLVINFTALLSGDWGHLEAELLGCLQPIRLHDKTIKVIIETGILTSEQIKDCCHFYAQFKVDFIKTSTGYIGPGANPDTISLLRKSLPEHIGIKASAGIRTYADAKKLIAAGAGRIGTSSGIQIIGEASAAQPTEPLI